MAKGMKIKKIVVEMKSGDLTLDYDTARELYQVLKELFGDKEVHFIPTYPYTRWTYTWNPASATVTMSDTGTSSGHSVKSTLTTT